MLNEATLSYFPIWTPKVSPNYLQHVFILKKTRRKNIWCSGLSPILLLVRSVWYLVGFWLDCWDDCSQCDLSLESLVIFLATWIASCPPSWREIDLEFRNSANNIVSLFPKKIFLSLGCETNLCSWSFGSSHSWILDTIHVCREYDVSWFLDVFIYGDTFT